MHDVGESTSYVQRSIIAEAREPRPMFYFQYMFGGTYVRTAYEYECEQYFNQVSERGWILLVALSFGELSTETASLTRNVHQVPVYFVL